METGHPKSILSISGIVVGHLKRMNEPLLLALSRHISMETGHAKSISSHTQTGPIL